MRSAAAPKPDDFRLRGREVSRLESFSDAVFGFAVTLLVVSLEVPKNFADLMETMRGFIAFGICFALLAMIWNDHYVYSRRFGLEDGFVRFLTCVMLFIVLLYVYPLKFLFTLFINGVILGGAKAQLTHSQGATLFVIYGAGFVAIYLTLAALYWHAYRRRADLDLNEIEVLDTRWEIYGMLCMSSAGVASALVALTARYTDRAGLVYFSLFLIMWIHGRMHGRRRRELLARQVAPVT